MRRHLLVSLVPLVLVACGGDENAAAPSSSVDSGGRATSAAQQEQRSGVARVAPDPAAPVDVAVRGVNNAGFGLLRQLFAGDDVVLSPTSVATAFAMAAAGADEATRAQLDAAFGFPAGEALPVSMNALTAGLVADPLANPGESETPVFELANTGWAQQGVQVGAPFLDVLATHYGAGVETVEFTAQEATRARINAWIAERTRDRIPELLAAPGLDPATRFALANAAYFKASWAAPFDEAATAPAPFTALDGTVVQADTMHAQLPVGYVLDEDVIAVHLPYVGGEYVMTIAMPDDLAGFVATADAETWRTLTDAAAQGDVVLSLPRWEAATTADLAAPLTAMGLPIPGGAYPGILPEATVNSVAHGANITVDELGTQAAAATVIGMVVSAPAEPPPTITIDRPFVYTITHAPTGTILFAGIETNPAT